MQTITPDMINQAKAMARPDMLIHISARVVLKPQGAQYYGLCPFHKESTPSFSVAPHKGLFKCFGCGFGGDVIKFIMKKDNLSFIDCMKYLISYYNFYS